MDTRSCAKNKGEFEFFLKDIFFPSYISFHFLLRGMRMHPMVPLAAGTLRCCSTWSWFWHLAFFKLG